ncbi:MAG: peptidase M4 [Acidobacteria bacterium]|nr:MAG: peptidase M4 [Acidobacteriota bacterium]
MNRSLVFAMAAVVGLALGPLAGAADDQAALAKQAKISKEKAQEIALKKAPGTVESSELEKEKGTLVYSFDIKTAKGGITEVLVSAIDGHIVDVSHETAAKEAAEKKKEAHEKKQSQTKTTHH